MFVRIIKKNKILSNLLLRSIAGIVFVAAVIGAAWSGSLLLGLLFLLFAVVGLFELYEMMRKDKRISVRTSSGLIIGTLIYLALFLHANEALSSSWLWGLSIPIVLFFCAEIFRKNSNDLQSLVMTSFGWLYVILPFALINYLGRVMGNYEKELIIGYFFVLWTNDTGAYLSGMTLGKHKLLERISPKKTWEGLFGGIVFAVGIAYLTSLYFETISTKDWIVVALIIAIFANLGDLFESYIKRIFGVKDSGKIIPGHGGSLDRFDGLLLSLPIVVAYLKIIEVL